VVNVEGQLPGSDEITLLFSVQSIGEPTEVEVTILASGEGNLIGNLNCGASRLGLLYLTSSGEPIPDALISVTSFDWPVGSPNFIFSPASDSGSSAGITDASGAVTVRYSTVLPPAQEEDRTVTYTATFETGNGDANFELECGFTIPGTGPEDP
jgi:hypothetical protein